MNKCSHTQNKKKIIELAEVKFGIQLAMKDSSFKNSSHEIPIQFSIKSLINE